MMNIDETGDEYSCVEVAVVAKSSIVLDVKPQDDATDMAKIERCCDDEYSCVEAAAVAKSSIVLDVKPWDDETDMAEIERCCDDEY